MVDCAFGKIGKSAVEFKSIIFLRLISLKSAVNFYRTFIIYE